MNSKTMKRYVIDAFTDHVFAGNPAAVCVMDAWLPDGMGIPAQPEGDQLCFHCGIRPHQRTLLHLPIIHMGSFPIKLGKGENGGCL